MSKVLHCLVTGKVQGVGYRAATQGKAMELGIHGWVKNLADGRVEVLCSGSDKQLGMMRAWLSRGPDLARVSYIDCQEVDATVPEDFQIHN